MACSGCRRRRAAIRKRALNAKLAARRLLQKGTTAHVVQSNQKRETPYGNSDTIT